MLSKRLLAKRQTFIEGPRSAWDCIEIDHMPKDHWIAKRLRYSIVHAGIAEHLRYCPWNSIPWFHNEYHSF